MKNKAYKHLSAAERLEIAWLKSRGRSIRDIAQMLERSPNTISAELCLNKVNGVYDARKAQHKAYVRRKYSKYQGMKIVEDINLRNYVEEKMAKDWSPEEISGRIREIDKHLKYVGFKGIYKFISSCYGRSLERYLRYKGKKRKSGNGIKVCQLKNRVFVDQRPEITNKRQRFGDWEGDFIVSGKQGRGVLLVLSERKGRYVLIGKLASRKEREINQYLQEMFGIFVDFNSLTLDNDICFKKHEKLSKMLGVPIYFCHPYHAWEKGGVENINKLIRQYIKKGSDISQYGGGYIQEIQDKLNNRPRKCLGYLTPAEVMTKNRQFKTLENFVNINQNKNRAECPA